MPAQIRLPEGADAVLVEQKIRRDADFMFANQAQESFIVNVAVEILLEKIHGRLACRG